MRHFKEHLKWLKEVHPENAARIEAENLRRGELLRKNRAERLSSKRASIRTPEDHATEWLRLLNKKHRGTATEQELAQYERLDAAWSESGSAYKPERQNIHNLDVPKHKPMSKNDFAKVRALHQTASNQLEPFGSGAQQIQKQIRKELDRFGVSSDDHEKTRPSLDVQNQTKPEPAPLSDYEKTRREHRYRVEPYGYVWVGSKTHSIYSGLPAEQVDHCPSMNYVLERVPPYPESAPKFYVASTEEENGTKAHFGAACITLCAAKIVHHFTTRKKWKENANAALSARLIEKKWSTAPECPCIACARSQPLLRWKECQSSDYVMEKMPRRSRK